MVEESKGVPKKASSAQSTGFFSINLYTQIILMIGLHEFDAYNAFTRASKSFRKAVIMCLPLQK